MRPFLIVFFGSGLGGAMRYLVGVAALRLLGPAFPYGTLFINVLGSALMGLAAGLLAARGEGSLELRLLLATGLIGGFTTWSTFVLDTVTLWQRGAAMPAIAYVAGSLVLSLAVMIAMMLATRHWA